MKAQAAGTVVGFGLADPFAGDNGDQAAVLTCGIPLATKEDARPAVLGCPPGNGTPVLCNTPPWRECCRRTCVLEGARGTRAQARG